MATGGTLNMKVDKPLMGATVKVNVNVSATRGFKARRFLFIQLMRLAVWIAGGSGVETQFERAA